MAKSEFVRQMRQAYPMYVSPISDYKSTVQILKNRSLLFEDKKEVDDSFKYSTESLRRAIDIELEAAGLMSHETISGEDQEKARVKAVANLKKDPLHYYHIIAGESSKVDKHDQPKETKRGKLEKDTFNDMKKATLKEMKQNLVEGTRALVGYLSGDRLTTTYNHYDGYPSNLGAGLEAHYNDDDKAKEVAMKGYITYLNPETGEIEATHNDAPGKVILPDDPEQRAREIAEEIDKFGADFGYVWDDESNQWITIKNTGIRSMIDQMMDKLSMMNVYSGDKMNSGIEEVDASLDPYEDKKEIIKQVIQLIKRSMPADNETIKSFIRTHYNDIINLGDDEAILDEFQEFLSVNTDYVDEAEQLDTTAAYKNDDDTQAMIDKMRKDGKDSEDFVDEKKVTEDAKQTNFSSDEIKSVSFPNGLSVTVGQPHPEEEGIVNFIRKGENGYEIGFVDGSEGGSYRVDFNGEFLDEDDYIEENKATKDHDGDGEIISYIADTYIQNAKDGDEAYAEFRDLNLRDAVQDVVGILKDRKHPLYRETRKEYQIVSKDKARGLFEKKGKDHDGDGDIDGDDYKHAKDKAIKKAMGKELSEGLTVVGHTPEEQLKNAEELVATAKKAGRDAKIKYDGDRIVNVDIGAPGLRTPDEVQAVQDRQFADYRKNKPKDTKPSFKAKKLKKLTKGGKTYEVGDFDPNDDGRIMSIEKYPNGYYIQGGVYSDYGDGDEPKEGYGYAIDLKGNEMDEEDLEGMYESYAMKRMQKAHNQDRLAGKKSTYDKAKDKDEKKPKMNEAVKNIITKVLEEQYINEAATNDLAKIADEYGDFEGLKPAVIALENIVTEIESFYDKTRSKIQKIYNDLGEIKNEEGLKVGAFIAPSIENAFKRDLRPIIKNQFHGGLDMPKVKRISQADVDRGYIQQEAPKETVFTPVNENKKKYNKSKLKAK